MFGVNVAVWPVRTRFQRDDWSVDFPGSRTAPAYPFPVRHQWPYQSALDVI
jgi:hypothetical protein